MEETSKKNIRMDNTEKVEETTNTTNVGEIKLTVLWKWKYVFYRGSCMLSEDVNPLHTNKYTHICIKMLFL